MEVSASEDDRVLAGLARAARVNLILEPEEDLGERLARAPGRFDSVRARRLGAGLQHLANDLDLQVIDWPVLANGRLELLHYHKEQSVTETRHRYGNLLVRPDGGREEL